MVTAVQGIGITSPRRHLFIVPGPMLATATYAPYVGCLRTQDDIAFLRDTIDITHSTAAKLGITHIWLLGDFNLRGIAPGTSMPPPLGSGHASLSEEFAGMLQAAGKHPLMTPATHRRGGGVDLLESWGWSNGTFLWESGFKPDSGHPIKYFS